MKIDNRSLAVLLIAAGIMIPVAVFLHFAVGGSERRQESRRVDFLERPNFGDEVRERAYGQDVPDTEDLDRIFTEETEAMLLSPEEERLTLRGDDYTYTIKVGDSLRSIALKYLGDPKMVHALYELNEDLAAGIPIQPGQKIVIPLSRRR